MRVVVLISIVADRIRQNAKSWRASWRSAGSHAFTLQEGATAA
jgi:hypothetical protein